MPAGAVRVWESAHASSLDEDQVQGDRRSRKAAPDDSARLRLQASMRASRRSGAATTCRGTSHPQPLAVLPCTVEIEGVVGMLAARSRAAQAGRHEPRGIGSSSSVVLPVPLQAANPRRAHRRMQHQQEHQEMDDGIGSMPKRDAGALTAIVPATKSGDRGLYRRGLDGDGPEHQHARGLSRRSARRCAGWLSLRRCGMTLLQAAPLTCRPIWPPPRCRRAASRGYQSRCATLLPPPAAPRPRIAVDPTGAVEPRSSAAGWARCRKPVEALLAPDAGTSLGLRDRHARTAVRDRPARQRAGHARSRSGQPARRCAARQQKGNKERLVPIGETALDWHRRYLAEARPALLGMRLTGALFVTSRGESMTRQNGLVPDQALRDDRRHRPDALVTAYAAPCLRDASGQLWRRLRVVQLLLGHSDLSTTRIYARRARAL